jgi:hypothetical protein
MMALRKQIFSQMYALGLRASQATVSPAKEAGCVCLTIKLSCPYRLRSDFTDMALRCLQLPTVRRVHFGLHKMADKTDHPRELHALRA